MLFRSCFAALAALLCVPLLAQEQQKRGGPKAVIWGQCPGGPPVSGAPRVDPNYSRIAAETGGQVFDVRGADIEKLGAVLGPRLAANAGSVVIANGSLRDPEPREWVVLVDSTARSVTFSTTIELKCAITVLRPSGAAVSQQEQGVMTTALSAGRVVTVHAPEPGPWRVRVSGFGFFSVQAFVDGPLRFDSFQFVRQGGRPGHEGLFPLEGMPVAGQPHMGRAELNGPFRSAAFLLVNELGEVLREVKLSRVDGEEFVGLMELPEEPFRVVVTGYDERGVQYQRVYGPLYGVMPANPAQAR